MSLPPYPGAPNAAPTPDAVPNQASTPSQAPVPNQAPNAAPYPSPTAAPNSPQAPFRAPNPYPAPHQAPNSPQAPFQAPASIRPPEPPATSSVARVRMRWWQWLLVGVAAIVSVALPVSGGVYAASNARLIHDRTEVANFSPTPEVEELVERTGMNETGEFLFYTSHPQLNTANEFNTACGVRPEQLLLGCYTGTTIHIYDVAEQRLDGMREVTAAHEMLHAGFARLDDGAQDRLGELLEEAYTAHGDDPELAERMAAYATAQPGTRTTELHSIIGTEFAELSPELEQHYSRYFADRQKVVALHASYAKVFTDLEAQAESLSDQVLALADEIDADMTKYNNDQTQLNADIDAFIAKNNAYGYSGDAAGFDADKAALMARDQELNTRLGTINSKRTQLGDLQQQLRDIDADAQALNRSIDSTVVPGEGI